MFVVRFPWKRCWLCTRKKELLELCLEQRYPLHDLVTVWLMRFLPTQPGILDALFRILRRTKFCIMLRNLHLTFLLRSIAACTSLTHRYLGLSVKWWTRCNHLRMKLMTARTRQAESRKRICRPLLGWSKSGTWRRRITSRARHSFTIESMQEIIRLRDKRFLEANQISGVRLPPPPPPCDPFFLILDLLSLRMRCICNKHFILRRPSRWHRLPSLSGWSGNCSSSVHSSYCNRPPNSQNRTKCFYQCECPCRARRSNKRQYHPFRCRNRSARGHSPLYYCIGLQNRCMGTCWRNTPWRSRACWKSHSPGSQGWSRDNFGEGCGCWGRRCCA